MKISCNVINDLLPLYIDDVLSEDSRLLIREHIGECESCRKTADKMSESLTIPNDTKGYEIRRFKKHMSEKRLIGILLSTLITLAVAFCLGFYVLLGGNAVNSKNVDVRTEFQYSDDAYLNQSWVIHFMLKNNKPINTFNKSVWEKDSTGVEVCVGEIIYIRELPIVIPGAVESNNFTTGYSCQDYNGESDFTITVVYKDKSVVYSMRDEGLYEKQVISNGL